MNEDVRYAIRSLRANPGFALTAVACLALGVGANTAIFSVTRGLLMRPLPYKEADRLAILWNRSPGLNIAEDWFSTAQYFDIKRGHKGFEEVAIAIGGNYNLTGDGEAERAGVILISSNLLPMLGTEPLRGRAFTTAEDVPGQAPAAVLGYGMWIRRYGGDASVLGRSITLNAQSYRIVGVMPREFTLPREVLPTLGGAERADVLLPLPLSAAAVEDRDHEDYNVIAKLKPGVTIKQAQSEMDGITARLRREHPDVYPPNGGLTFGVVGLLDQVVGNVRLPLLVLLGSVGFVLLIACANVANLLLSRACGRQKEIAVRAALGASRGRIVSQLLTESVVLAAAGGALGILLAFGCLEWIRHIEPKGIPRLNDIGIDGGVLLFTLAISVASGVLFGMAPALRLSRLDVQSSLKDSARGASGANSLWAKGNNERRLLVLGEVALSVVLLVGAGLLIRSFGRVQDVTPGFNPKQVLTLALTMTGKRYEKPVDVLNTYRELRERLEKLPGVTAAGGITSLPLNQSYAWGPITVEGRVPAPGENFINVDIRMVAGHYLQAMQIPLLRGRYFNEADTQDKPHVVIVDDLMAEQLWPGHDPVGKRIRRGGADSKEAWEIVVGVVGRVKQYTLDSGSRIAMYLPHTQYPTRAMSVVVRGAGEPGALVGPVKSLIREMDPDLPVYSVRTMEQRVEDSLARRRFLMQLLELFAELALTVIGLYGVMAYLVSQGAKETGIRIALGATPAQIASLVMRQGGGIAGGGALLGLAAAYPLTRLMEGLLFGVQATDTAVYITAPAVLVIVALAAIYVPARRAARTDPMIPLRGE